MISLAVVVDVLLQQDMLSSWPKTREQNDRRGRDREKEVGGSGCTCTRITYP
jgi:hypothetical protein